MSHRREYRLVGKSGSQGKRARGLQIEPEQDLSPNLQYRIIQSILVGLEVLKIDIKSIEGEMRKTANDRDAKTHKT